MALTRHQHNFAHDVCVHARLALLAHVRTAADALVPLHVLHDVHDIVTHSLQPRRERAAPAISAASRRPQKYPRVYRPTSPLRLEAAASWPHTTHTHTPRSPPRPARRPPDRRPPVPARPDAQSPERRGRSATLSAHIVRRLGRNASGANDTIWLASAGACPSTSRHRERDDEIDDVTPDDDPEEEGEEEGGRSALRSLGGELSEPPPPRTASSYRLIGASARAGVCAPMCSMLHAPWADGGREEASGASV
eukprot:scaffold2560_cov116-Isochrysis_galbana.AAC.6